MGKEEADEQDRLNKKWNQLSEAAKKRTIWINRIPIKTRDEFLKLADEEFEGDWGMCLKYCLEQSKEYQKVKKQLFKLIEQNDKNL